MDISEIRRHNLIRLLLTAKERDGLNRKEFAAKCDTDPAVISQITSTTQKINKNMGSDLARRIERSMNLPRGWMDIAKCDEEKKGIIVMRGSSMESRNPRKTIPDGAQLTVRHVSDESQISGKVVLIELGDSKEPVVKEIQIDGENKYLVPWNERYEVIKLTGRYKILGYVTEFLVTLSR